VHYRPSGSGSQRSEAARWSRGTASKWSSCAEAQVSLLAAAVCGKDATRSVAVVKLAAWCADGRRCYLVDNRPELRGQRLPRDGPGKQTCAPRLQTQVLSWTGRARRSVGQRKRALRARPNRLFITSYFVAVVMEGSGMRARREDRDYPRNDALSTRRSVG
jgi:hypothetical protein